MSLGVSIPKADAIWCEFWLRLDEKEATQGNTSVESIISEFSSVCKSLSIELALHQKLRFPERVIVLAKANGQQLKDLVEAYGNLAEIRLATIPNFEFLTENREEQKGWCEDLLSRITYDFTQTSICILDTGVNASHPLLTHVFDQGSTLAVKPSWNITDTQGHGTQMAGVALYFDLKEKLLSQNPVKINHHLESVKIINQTNNNEPELYGQITQQAIALSEIEHPEFKRVVCLATTAKGPEQDYILGKPSSWSGAIDSLAFGDIDEPSSKRLLFVSAGNLQPQEFDKSTNSQNYLDQNVITSIENPAQSWNAVTVGAYAEFNQIADPVFSKAGFKPLAGHNQLCPYSKTSITWEKEWPNKPDILCCGGNLATNGQEITNCEDLAILTTSNQINAKRFSTIDATSAATAQAAYLASQIYAQYPNHQLWPETVRALLVHSATWPKPLLEKFMCDKKHYTQDCKHPSRQNTSNLLRTCGYGIPNLETALHCFSNNVCMVIQGELQPCSSKDNTNRIHIHSLPWPKKELEKLGEIDATLRVTLSYFIEPAPGIVDPKNKYRYASYGLEFSVNNTNETIEEFQFRRNKIYKEEHPDEMKQESETGKWFIGREARTRGTIQSDFITESAINLCNTNFIAVYPTKGWWGQRTNLKKLEYSVRYSLIVSITTPSIKADLLTPVLNAIATRQKTLITPGIRNL
jgi:hypothetical protein